MIVKEWEAENTLSLLMAPGYTKASAIVLSGLRCSVGPSVGFVSHRDKWSRQCLFAFLPLPHPPPPPPPCCETSFPPLTRGSRRLLLGCFTRREEKRQESIKKPSGGQNMSIYEPYGGNPISSLLYEYVLEHIRPIKVDEVNSECHTARGIMIWGKYLPLHFMLDNTRQQLSSLGYQ